MQNVEAVGVVCEAKRGSSRLEAVGLLRQNVQRLNIINLATLLLHNGTKNKKEPEKENDEEE